MCLDGQVLGSSYHFLNAALSKHGQFTYEAKTAFSVGLLDRTPKPEGNVSVCLLVVCSPDSLQWKFLKTDFGEAMPARVGGYLQTTCGLF